MFGLFKDGNASGYGGFWVDATVYCIKPLNEWIHDYITNGFFAYSGAHFAENRF